MVLDKYPGDIITNTLFWLYFPTTPIRLFKIFVIAKSFTPFLREFLRRRHKYDDQIFLFNSSSYNSFSPLFLFIYMIFIRIPSSPMLKNPLSRNISILIKSYLFNPTNPSYEMPTSSASQSIASGIVAPANLSKVLPIASVTIFFNQGLLSI